MSRINLSRLSPRDAGRVNKALDMVYNFFGETKTMRAWLEALPEVRKTESQGGIFNRHHFNRLGSEAEQRAYEERLRTKRRYYINDVEVPKMIYDVVACEQEPL